MFSFLVRSKYSASRCKAAASLCAQQEAERAEAVARLRANPLSLWPGVRKMNDYDRRQYAADGEELKKRIQAHMSAVAMKPIQAATT